MSISSPSNLSPVKQVRFQDLMNRGKEFVKDGKVREGLEVMKEALTICRTTKLLSRIQKCEEYLQREEEEEENAEADEQIVEIYKGFSLTRELHDKLYPYQREGIAWMFKLYRQEKGGVLGDDMGLGKTIQIIGFLSGMFQADLIRNALIIMPVSLLPNWKQEFSKWCPDLMVCIFHGGSKKERERNLYRIQRRGGVLITSYGLIVSNEESFRSFNGRNFIWDYIILDEGHKIKNPTKTTKAVHNLASKNRLILTGTPVQNNLEELWALYDFAHQGTLLGSRQTFKMQYENPITHARAKNSTIGERKLGTEIAHNLRKLIEPYFLRRTKEEVLKSSENKENIDSSDVNALADKMQNMKLSTLSRKNDLIMWTFLSDVQYKIYTGFLQSEAVKNILMTNKSPLVQLTVLKKICDHPRLLSNRSGFQFLINDDMGEDDVEKQFEEEEAATVSIEDVSDEELIAESGKMGVLIHLLENLKSEGHRTLVFSLSRKILDIIQKILKNRSWKVLRIDGTITKIEERAKRVNLFQTDSSYPILLLTTQVGGVGLTLTAADRVVIYDPSWNPSTDAQAVDRVYRIGQSKNVVVYRFITCGTVEEKIYRRQVFKDSIIKQATGDSKDPYRYFTHQELYELFTVDNVRYSTTQVQLAEMHSQQRKTDTSLDEHIAYLHSLDIFGISDHDLMFTRNVKDETEDNDGNVVCEAYIKKRVEEAQHMVQVEANLIQEDLRRAGTYSRPYSVTVPLSRKATEKDNYKPPNFPDDTSQPSMGKDMPGPFGDLKTDMNMLKTEDEQSISIQSSIRVKSSPPARAANDKYKVPLLTENGSPLNREDNETGEGKMVDEFEIDDVNSPIAAGTRRALFQEAEVIDIVTPGPFLSTAPDKHSRIHSPRISDFSKSMEKRHNSTMIETNGISAISGQAKSNRSKLFLLGAENRTNDSNNYITSADNSVEIIASDSDEEIKTPPLSKKRYSFDMSRCLQGRTQNSDSSHLGTTIHPVSVIEDSMTSESNSFRVHPDATEKLLREPKRNSVFKSLMEQHPVPQITVLPTTPVQQCLTGNSSIRESKQEVIFSPQSVEKSTDSKTGASRLWRFEEMHKALSKSCEAAKSALSSEKNHLSGSRKMGTSFDGHTGSLNKTNDLIPVGKVSTPQTNAKVKSEFKALPLSKVSTPQTNTQVGGASSKQKIDEKFASEEDANNEGDLAACEYGSPRRITPLKVSSKKATPVKLSPFAKAIASSPVISSQHHSNTPGSKSKKSEAPKAPVSSNKSELNETGEPVSFKDVLSGISSHDCADDSPIALTKKKKKFSRKLIASDSDTEESGADDPSDNEHTTDAEKSGASNHSDNEHTTDAEESGADDPSDNEHTTDAEESDASNSSDTEHSSGAEGSDGESLKDFVVSDDDMDEQNSLNEEGSNYEEESEYEDDAESD